MSGHIPLSFRHGLIIPIPKGHNKDMTNPSNYCGITLSSVMSKVFEKIILLRLVDLASQLNPLRGGGVRTGHSCLHTAFILQEAIFSLREQRKKAFVAFIDVKKAFDTVWHIGLMFNVNFPSTSGALLTHGMVVPHLPCSGILLFHIPSVFGKECVRVPLFHLCFTHSSWMICWTVCPPLVVVFQLMVSIVGHQCMPMILP